MTLPALARPTRDINHVLSYGGAIACGRMAWPALSLAQPRDSLMLGDSVRPVAALGARWQPTGETALRPLIATVQDPATGLILTPVQITTLAPDAAAYGETVLEAAVNHWRARMLTAGAPPERRRLLASACGVADRALAALSRRARPDLFNRLRDCATLARATAEAAGLTYGISAVLLLHDEPTPTVAAARLEDAVAAHQAVLQRLYQDVVTDLGEAIAGQPEPPALLLYQSAGNAASETNAEAQAQLAASLETPGIILVAPAYALTERGGTLDANGQRWLGAQFGKVLHRVLTLGETWRPLHPLRAENSGKLVRAAFHVPVPPLVWGQPIVGDRFVDPQQRGFTVLDAAGSISITDVRIEGDDAVTITLARAPQGDTTLRYADLRHGGRGALHDSDAEVALDRYVYDAARGGGGGGLSVLVGRPYPLNNWCVAFAIPVTPAVQPPPPRTQVWDILNDTSRPPPPPPVAARGWLSRLLRRRD
jgi:hypothetical protein